MKESATDKVAFARVLDALRPYLEDLVFVGGWAHRLQALHPLARSPGFQLLTTEDADIAAPTDLKQKRAGSIAALLKKSGFRENFSGDDRPPVTEYTLAAELVTDSVKRAQLTEEA